MLGQMPAHKAIAVAAVLLLHLVLLWFLLQARIITVSPPAIFREQPITLWLQTAIKPKPPELEQKKTEKEKPGPSPTEHAIGTPVPTPQGAPPASSDYNGLRALGRYLSNCSNAAYEKLSNKELAHCLGNQWKEKGEGPIGLGIEPPSEWKAQMDKKKAPIVPMEQECPQGTPNSNLGLPCFHFGK